jgi:hypothetical protein
LTGQGPSTLPPPIFVGFIAEPDEHFGSSKIVESTPGGRVKGDAPVDCFAGVASRIDWPASRSSAGRLDDAAPKES